MITIKDLKFKYPNNPSPEYLINIKKLTFKNGSKIMITGKSGSGKTTLLNLISGLLLPQTGSIMLSDIQINKLRDKDRRIFRLNKIGYILQETSLLNYLTVKDNIKLPYFINPALTWQDQFEKNLLNLAEKAGITKILNKYPDQISAGERQRCAILRGFITEPKLLLADEPTANLDPSARDNVLNILDDFINEKKSTLIMVSHDTTQKSFFNSIYNIEGND